MSVNQPAPRALRDLPVAHYFRHYGRLLWRTKWMVLGIAAGIASLAALYFAKFDTGTPKQEASALIGIENPAQISAVGDGGLGEGRSELIGSRTFLKDIVDRMSLRLSIPRGPRDALIDSAMVDSTALSGSYRLVFDPVVSDSFVCTMTNKILDIYDKVVRTGPIANFRDLAFPGVFLRFNAAFCQNPHSLSFGILDSREAIERLHKKIDIEPPDPRRNLYNIKVTMTGTDYRLIAQCVNAIADNFVDKNLSFRTRRTRHALEILDKQLQTAREELDQAQVSIKTFRTENPTVGLNETAQQTVTSITQNEAGSYQLSSALSDAQELRTKLAGAKESERFGLLSEIAVFLTTNGDVSASVQQTELNKALDERKEVEKSYDKTHPVVLEVHRRLEKLAGAIKAELDDFIAKQNARLTDQKRESESLSARLHGLPSKELQLAELQRRLQVSGDLYSTVLNRYNQARIADAAEVADFFVMDYAIPPIPPPVSLPLLIALIAAISFGLALAPVIVTDLFAKTAWTDFDYQQRCKYPLLEALPIYKIPSRGKDQVDPSLVAARSPSELAVELLRSLRHKILYRLQPSGKNIFAVTSIDAGVGKSTLCANLAIIYARQNLRTVIVDADARRSKQHELFGHKPEKGLIDFLKSDTPIDVHTVSQYLVRTPFDGLACLYSGRLTPDSAELLASARMNELIAALSILFDIIIIDTPPVGAVSDAALFHASVGGYLVVARAGHTPLDDMIRIVREYHVIESKLLGIVLNGAIVDAKKKYYSDGKYAVTIIPKTT